MSLADEGAVPAQRQDGRTGDIVHWFVLILSGVLEAVWATALAASDRFRRPPARPSSSRWRSPPAWRGSPSR